MAWPRIKNSRSSAQPGTQPHTGVQATVTPAADADPPPHSSQNTGVVGTRYAVAENPSQDARSPRHDRSASRRLGPIRYAHSGVDDAQSAEAADAAEPAQSAEPADDGISIFGDIATSEVPADSEPALDFRTPHRSPAGETARHGRGAGRRRAGRSDSRRRVVEPAGDVVHPAGRVRAGE